MSPFLLVNVVVVIWMAKMIADLYAGGRYVCPSCGARNERNHSNDCPWSRRPSP